jgi:ATP-dependent protease ClpP protease subunit
VKNNIAIRGIIVSALYHSFSDYITRGVICPESIIREKIEAADKNHDLNIYINSPGGSVFAGNEMINNLNSWRAATGKHINIEVGAMAASMAANLIAQVGETGRVKVHSNTKIMFHGAFGYAEAGEQGFRDYADLLAKINADVKTTLVARFGLDPDLVDIWFSEGREGWLDARQAVKLGLASEVIRTYALPPERMENAQEFLKERGAKLAAALIENHIKKENTMWEKIKAILAGKGFEDVAEDTAEKIVLEMKTPAEFEAALAQAKAEDAAALEQIKADLATAKTSIEELATAKAGIETHAKNLETQLADNKAQLKAATDKLANLTAGIGVPSDGEPPKGKAAFFAAVEARMKKDGTSREQATLLVSREDKDLFQSMLEEVNKR